MASVAKRGSVYCVRYRVTDSLGATVEKRVSGFQTKEAAWEAARSLETASNAGIDVNGDKASCGLIMERWFSDHVANNAAQTTAAKYSAAIDVLKKTQVYSLPVKKLTQDVYAKLLNALQKINDGIALRTALTYAEPLRLSLSWATRLGLIPRNPIQGYKYPQIPKRAQKVLNEADIDDIVSEAKDKTFYIPLLLALYGGLRREEAAGLTWSNVDFKRGTITIVSVNARTCTGIRVEKGPKNNASMRTIVMPRFVINVLQSVGKISTSVCASDNGNPYALDSYPQAVRRIIEAVNRRRIGTDTAPMPKVTYHDLRHTHAAMLIKMGIQPKVIQERLGHSSIKITMDLYGYLMTGLQENVASQLDSQFQARTSGHKSGHKDEEKLQKTHKYQLAFENPKCLKAQ